MNFGKLALIHLRQKTLDKSFPAKLKNLPIARDGHD